MGVVSEMTNSLLRENKSVIVWTLLGKGEVVENSTLKSLRRMRSLVEECGRKVRVVSRWLRA